MLSLGVLLPPALQHAWTWRSCGLSKGMATALGDCDDGPLSAALVSSWELGWVGWSHLFQFWCVAGSLLMSSQYSAYNSINVSALSAGDNE